jgi:Flp pilus assembly protein TadB
MTTPNPIRPPGAPDAYKPLSPAEKIEEDASLASLAAGEALRAGEVALVVFIGLLVCPPLAILAVVVVVPILVTALVLGLLAAVLSTPYLLVHHYRRDHRDHAALLAHRLRRAGRALVDLLPHRIVADARKIHAGR